MKLNEVDPFDRLFFEIKNQKIDEVLSTAMGSPSSPTGTATPGSTTLGGPPSAGTMALGAAPGLSNTTERNKQRQEIQKQIQQKQKEIRDLQQQLSGIK